MGLTMTKQEFEKEFPDWGVDEETVESLKIVHKYIPDDYLCMSTEDSPDWVFRLFTYTPEQRVIDLPDGSVLWKIVYKGKDVYNWMDMTGQIYFPSSFMQIRQED